MFSYSHTKGTRDQRFRTDIFSFSGGWGEECVTSGPLHTTSTEFENRAFTLKTHQMFFVHTKNATITGHFGFVFEETSVREITWLSSRPGPASRHRFLKAPSTRKRKAGVFKFVQFEERFRKVPFSWRISVDGRPNRIHTPICYRIQ